ncbi:MAG TPA: DUF3168 domain-containing protein [Pedomonas sp.]|uniref:DUF3168 domain-containing protein n=1 Tax=Pedomonas sp. TaxID=2976421 RepID=UPI002F40DB53
MLANAIYQRLAGHVQLAAMVGTKIYPSRAPDEAALPYVTYLDMAALDQAQDLNGKGDLSLARVQVDAWATTAMEAKHIGDAVQAALEDFTGTVAGVRIADVTLIGGFDDWEGGTGDTPTVTYRRMREFYVWIET